MKLLKNNGNVLTSFINKINDVIKNNFVDTKECKIEDLKYIVVVLNEYCDIEDIYYTW